MIILSGRDGVCNPVANVSCEATAFGTAANPFGLFKEEHAGNELTCPPHNDGEEFCPFPSSGLHLPSLGSGFRHPCTE
ncbi:MAG: hypothetical protein NTX45_10715 [Proteobacteria bacterium]|nr:hypothetical protein [Pseudomonadota bacterium]